VLPGDLQGRSRHVDHDDDDDGDDDEHNEEEPEGEELSAEENEFWEKLFTLILH